MYPICILHYLLSLAAVAVEKRIISLFISPEHYRSYASKLLADFHHAPQSFPHIVSEISINNHTSKFLLRGLMRFLFGRA